MTPARWKRPLWGAAIGSLLVLAAWWPTLASLASLWSENQTYQFAWLVFPTAAYVLAWHDRQATLSLSPVPGFAGLALAIFAALLWSAADLLEIDVARQFALILALHAVALSALGWRSYWKLFPALALLFLAIPSGDVFVPLLRTLTLKVIVLFATLAQYPLRVDGFIVWVGPHDYVVLNECAGLSQFLLATFLGYAFGLLLFRTLGKVVLLAMFGAFIGILSNALRVCAIVLIDWINGSQMSLSAHGDIQWVALFLSLGLFFWAFSALDADPAAAPAPSTPWHGLQSGQKAWLPVAAGLVVALVAGGQTWLLTRQPMQPPAHPLTLPQTFSGWEVTGPVEHTTPPPQAATRAASASYARAGKTLTVRLVEATSGNAKLTGLEVAPVGKNTWYDYGAKPQSACAGTVCSTFMHTIWSDSVTGRKQHVYVVFALADQFTHSKLVLRARQALNRLSGDGAKPRVWGFALEEPPDADALGDLGVAARSLQSMY